MAASPGRQRLVSGLSLIVLGLALFWLKRTEGLDAGAIFLVVGGLLFAAYLYTRNYGLLIPGAILLGLGFGTTGDFALARFGRPEMLGLGIGFVLIFVVALAYERRTHWWPLVPGGILILFGIPDAARAVRWIGRNWPLLIVAVGLMVLLGAFGGGAKKGERGG